MAESGEGKIEEGKVHNANLARVSGAIEALFKHDGWQIFTALLEKKKKAIKDKSDYETLEEFKGDRRAIEIWDEIIEEMEGYVEDAESALVSLNAQDDRPSRGILMLEGLDGDNREAA